jgi:hypothetical protein
MDEYREIVRHGPVLLQRADLAELERVLSQDLSPRPGDLRIRVIDGARTVVATSMDELFQQQLPRSTSQLYVHTLSWNQQNDIDAGVSVSLNRNCADYQLHAVNETLFLGKKAQLDGFFRRHRPWYAIITTLLPIVGPSLFLSALFSAALLAGQRSVAAAALSATLAIVTAIVIWLRVTERVFPYVRVRFVDRNTSRSGWELTTFCLEVALLIATIVSILLPLTRATSK